MVLEAIAKAWRALVGSGRPGRRFVWFGRFVVVGLVSRHGTLQWFEAICREQGVLTWVGVVMLRDWSGFRGRLTAAGFGVGRRREESHADPESEAERRGGVVEEEGPESRGNGGDETSGM